MLPTRIRRDNTQTFKTVVLGSIKSGKSALVQRAVSGDFSTNYRTTLGVDLILKDVYTEGGERMLLQIWCCSGNRRYLALNQSVFADATAVLLVYDTTDASSFEELIFWYNEAQREAPESIIFLIGTKSDLVEDLVVPEEDAKKQAQAWDCPHIIVSSLTGNNTDKLLDDLVHAIATQHH